MANVRSTPAFPQPAAVTVATPAPNIPVALSTAIAGTSAPSTASASGSQPPSPAQQLMTVLGPLRSSEDGTHEVTIGLEPEGLGTVKATITVSAQQIVVQLGTDNAQTRDVLRLALPLLRHELGGDGSSATVLLSDERQSGREAVPGDGKSTTAESGPDDDGDDTSDAPSLAVVSGTGHIDLHL